MTTRLLQQEWYRVPSIGPGDDYVDTFHQNENGTAERVRLAVMRQFIPGDKVMMTISEGTEVPRVIVECGWSTVKVCDEKFVSDCQWQKVRRVWPMECQTFKQDFERAGAFLAKLRVEMEEKAALEKKNKEEEAEKARFASMNQTQALAVLSLATKRLETLALEKK